MCVYYIAVSFELLFTMHMHVARIPAHTHMYTQSTYGVFDVILYVHTATDVCSYVSVDNSVVLYAAKRLSE